MSIIEPEVYDSNNLDHREVLITLTNDEYVQRIFYDFEYYVDGVLNSKDETSVEKAYVVKIDGVYVGMIMFTKLFDTHEISYAVLPQQRHKGYATMMLKYFVDYLFSLDNIDEIVMNIRKDNLYSIKTALNAGFTRDKHNNYVIKK